MHKDLANSPITKVLREFDQAVKNRAEMHDAHGVNSPEWVKANIEVQRLRKLVLGGKK